MEILLREMDVVLENEFRIREINCSSGRSNDYLFDYVPDRDKFVVSQKDPYPILIVFNLGRFENMK